MMGLTVSGHGDHAHRGRVVGASTAALTFLNRDRRLKGRKRQQERHQYRPRRSQKKHRRREARPGTPPPLEGCAARCLRAGASPDLEGSALVDRCTIRKHRLTATSSSELMLSAGPCEGGDCLCG